MDMTYSKVGQALTERFEGCRLTSYCDLAGKWTIGYGHTGLDVLPAMTIDQPTADRLLAADLQFAVRCVNGAVTVHLTQSEFDALVDFVFNIGCQAFHTSTLLKKLNAGDYQGAANQFAFWDHAGGKLIAGLLRRRQAEAEEFDTA